MVSLIDDKLIPREASPMVTLRNNLIPQKVGILVWRIQRKRIAVKEELDKRGIDLDSLLCPLCNDVVESVDHAIYSCKLAQEIWVGIYKWWDLPLPSGSNIEDAIKGGLSIGLNASQRKTWQAIVWVTCYFIWKNRNQKVFRNEAWASPKVINKIQVKSLEWVKNRSRGRSVDWHQWLLKPNIPRGEHENIDPG
ncbi:uncharacterized protein [Rutidosis leptorrhynchoides]|uniref:uncharacterized protein n=1 Tax=Rutidosis leptorrhynchoides TaxID=125765 RepID=UPI003A99CE9A